MTELARCPCGQIPTDLLIEGETDAPKWALCAGNCCSEWWLEYRNNYRDTQSEEGKRLAAEVWNEAPRSMIEEKQDDV